MKQDKSWVSFCRLRAHSGQPQILPGRREPTDIPSGKSEASKVRAVGPRGWSWSLVTMRLQFPVGDGFLHKVPGPQLLQLITHMIPGSKVIDQCTVLLL